MPTSTPPGSPRLAELAGCIIRLSDRFGRHPDWMPGLTLSRAARVTEPLSDVSRPVLALIAQGAKRTTLADRVYDTFSKRIKPGSPSQISHMKCHFQSSGRRWNLDPGSSYRLIMASGIFN